MASKTRVQLRANSALIAIATRAAREQGMDRNTYLCTLISAYLREGMPDVLSFDAVTYAIGGERDNLTIDMHPDDVVSLEAAADQAEVTRATWINLAMANEMIGGV